MDPEDLIDIDDSFNIRVRDSGNTTTTNTATVGVDVENVGNTDNSVNDSGNTWVDVVDSGNVDSHDQEWDIDGSFNSETDSSVNDNSINAGVREYNTSVGDVHLAGAGGGGGYGHGGHGHGGHGGGGGGGDVWVNSQSTIVDQSANQNILSGGEVNQFFGNTALTASGEGSIVAGDDITISKTLDASTNLEAGGDLNLNNTTDVAVSINSGNSFIDNSSDIDNSQEWDIDDSFNDESTNVSFDDSFNDDFTSTETENWDIDADVIWGSEDSVIVDDVDIELPPV